MKHSARAKVGQQFFVIIILLSVFFSNVGNMQAVRALAQAEPTATQPQPASAPVDEPAVEPTATAEEPAEEPPPEPTTTVPDTAAPTEEPTLLLTATPTEAAAAALTPTAEQTTGPTTTPTVEPTATPEAPTVGPTNTHVAPPETPTDVKTETAPMPNDLLIDYSIWKGIVSQEKQTAINQLVMENPEILLLDTSFELTAFDLSDDEDWARAVIVPKRIFDSGWEELVEADIIELLLHKSDTDNWIAVKFETSEFYKIIDQVPSITAQG